MSVIILIRMGNLCPFLGNSIADLVLTKVEIWMRTGRMTRKVTMLVMEMEQNGTETGIITNKARVITVITNKNKANKTRNGKTVRMMVKIRTMKT